MAIFLKGNMELAGLITLLNGMEAKQADQREHPANWRENAAWPQRAADTARLAMGSSARRRLIGKAQVAAGDTTVRSRPS
jgi:hypothetical protein